MARSNDLAPIESRSADLHRTHNLDFSSSTLVPSRSERLSRRRFLVTALALACYPLLPGMHSSAAGHADPCSDSIAEIFDIAATVEALAITFYYRAISTSGGFFSQLSSQQA